MRIAVFFVSMRISSVMGFVYPENVAIDIPTSNIGGEAAGCNQR